MKQSKELASKELENVNGGVWGINGRVEFDPVNRQFVMNIAENWQDAVAGTSTLGSSNDLINTLPQLGLNGTNLVNAVADLHAKRKSPANLRGGLTLTVDAFGHYVITPAAAAAPANP
jgi:hypothetical protein